MAAECDAVMTPFDAVPAEALRVVMLALPVDERARAATVCRSWRAFLADPSLWQVLDLTPSGGVDAPSLTEALFRGAVARAAGTLRTLRVHDDLEDWLEDVIVAAGGDLRQLSIDQYLTCQLVETLLQATPRLESFSAAVCDNSGEVVHLLSPDKPRGALRVGYLCLDDVAPVDVPALAAGIAANEALRGLAIWGMTHPRGLDLLLQAPCEQRLTVLEVCETCETDALNVPALARLIACAPLTALVVASDGFQETLEASMPTLCAALGTRLALRRLRFRFATPGGTSTDIVQQLLDTAATLPTLAVLDVSNSTFLDRVGAARALGDLIGFNLVALHTLRVDQCDWDDEHVVPMLTGLAANTHLRTLSCQFLNYYSPAFLRDQLEPALAALAARGGP